MTTITPRDWASHPHYIDPSYRSTSLRGPTKPLIPIEQTLSEWTGPVYGHESVGRLDADLTKNAQKNGEPLGERIIVTGRVMGDDGRAIRRSRRYGRRRKSNLERHALWKSHMPIGPRVQINVSRSSSHV